jgi:hypothetical protein
MSTEERWLDSLVEGPREWLRWVMHFQVLRDTAGKLRDYEFADTAIKTMLRDRARWLRN